MIDPKHVLAKRDLANGYKFVSYLDSHSIVSFALVVPHQDNELRVDRESASTLVAILSLPDVPVG